MRAFCRSPEKTWQALSLLREGSVEEGLRLFDELAEDDVDPVDWTKINVEWLIMAGHCLTGAEGSPQETFHGTTRGSDCLSIDYDAGPG